MILENFIWIIKISGILYSEKRVFWLVVDTVIFLVSRGMKSITYSGKGVNFYDNQIKDKNPRRWILGSLNLSKQDN